MGTMRWRDEDNEVDRVGDNEVDRVGIMRWRVIDVEEMGTMLWRGWGQ